MKVAFFMGNKYEDIDVLKFNFRINFPIFGILLY